MLKRCCLMLALLPIAGCVTDTRRDAVTFTVPPVASAVPVGADSADPLGLAQAIAKVRQEPWCFERRARR